jgi:hypothetical protein
MLVRLYDLPQRVELQRELGLQGTIVRRAMAYEKKAVTAWVEENFGQSAPGWTSECEVAFAQAPVACHIAVYHAAVVGFVCHDVTSKNVLGPIGVGPANRRSGVGTLLLLEALNAMRAAGYSYAIIGQVGASGFFSRAVGAVEIADSTPGLYPEPLAR